MSSPLHHHSGDTLQEQRPSSLIVHIRGLDFKSMLSNVNSLSKPVQHCVPLTTQEIQHFTNI